MRYKIEKYYSSSHFFVGISNIESLNAYSELKRETGGFLRAMLEGDLYSAVMYADIHNQQRLHHITKYITNILPPESYGSKEKVSKWLKKN